jgi:hypothetical protein
VNLGPRICYLLSALRIHSPDCEHCNPRESCGYAMRKRLEELNGGTQTRSVNNGVHEEVARGFTSNPPEILASPPISVKVRQKKAG